jgi:peptide alpha-N-acetyltransferase
MGTSLLHGSFYSLYEFAVFAHCSRAPCFQALNPADSSLIGVIICKLDAHASHTHPTRRGYIAMLAVASDFRGHGIATALVKKAIDAMIKRNADEVVLETEETNSAAMRLYERLGFLRSKKLHRYYLNGNSAYRLVLALRTVDVEANTNAFNGQVV